MAGIKGLVKDTAYYGISSIVGRFLNWLLVPLYTNMFSVGEYGVVTFVYAVTAVVMVVLTYGMETGFFRFANNDRGKDPMVVYSTTLMSLATTSAAFVVIVALFLSPFTVLMECAGHPSYVMIMAACVAIDAFLTIPYSYLRFRKRPLRFAYLRVVNIAVNIGLNLFFILLCPKLLEVAPATVDWFYNPEYGIGYIFLSNLLASAVNLVMMIPELRGFAWKFDPDLLKAMLRYSAPLLVLGVAGTMNQSIGPILFPNLVTDPQESMYGLGIYGANYKLGVILLVFLQAFRFAYEPFIFAKDKGQNKIQAYRDAMKYFIIFALFIFLGVMYFLDYIKYLINPRYFSGLKIVPLIMLGELFFGIYYNLSVWYKLTDRTQWGMYFSLSGFAITVLFNVLLVPAYGYVGCAWAIFFCNAFMMLASYFVGNWKYPIGYPVGRILAYFGIAALLYAAGFYGVDRLDLHPLIRIAVRAALLLLFIVITMKLEHIRPADVLATMRRRR